MLSRLSACVLDISPSLRGKPVHRPYTFETLTLALQFSDILAVSRMDNGLLGVSPFCFNLVDELQSAMTMFGVQAHTQGIDLQLELGDGVDDETCIVADPTRLCQILVNLMYVIFRTILP